jgi:hypothetical protein
MVAIKDIETYQTTPSVDGQGTFFFTDCGNRMYSVRNDLETYHGCICPKCGKTLYIRGSKEANEYWDRKLADLLNDEYIMDTAERDNDCPLVEIVTCKDCDYCRFELVEGIPYYWCDKDNCATSEDFYCADGERRE